MSIQSLILVAQPYYNEPGYQHCVNQAASTNYNRRLWPATVQWAMLDMLRHPPVGFEEVVKAHFRVKKHLILAQVGAWARGEDAPDPTKADQRGNGKVNVTETSATTAATATSSSSSSSSSGGCKKVDARLLDELRAELDKL